MFLPQNVIAYLKGLMCVFENANCVSLGRASLSSHDSLSRILNNEKLSWQTLLNNFSLKIFGKLRGGWLIIDDTVISKVFARKIENLSWVFDSKIGKSIIDLNIVVLIWTDGKRTVSVGLKIYRPHTGTTKIDLAIELLALAKRLHLRPDYVVFDFWYAASKLMKTIRQYRRHFILLSLSRTVPLTASP